jgi:hypothetical protein
MQRPCWRTLSAAGPNPGKRILRDGWLAPESRPVFALSGCCRLRKARGAVRASEREPGGTGVRR